MAHMSPKSPNPLGFGLGTVWGEGNDSYRRVRKHATGDMPKQEPLAPISPLRYAGRALASSSGGDATLTTSFTDMDEIIRRVVQQVKQELKLPQLAASDLSKMQEDIIDVQHGLASQIVAIQGSKSREMMLHQQIVRLEKQISGQQELLSRLGLHSDGTGSEDRRLVVSSSMLATLSDQIAACNVRIDGLVGSLKQGQQDFRDLLDREVKARASSDENVSQRLVTLQRQIHDVAMLATSARAATDVVANAARSPRDRTNVRLSDAFDTVDDTVPYKAVTKAGFETTLATLRSSLEAQVLETRRVARLELSESISKVTQQFIEAYRTGDDQLSQRISAVGGTLSSAVTDLAAELAAVKSIMTDVSTIQAASQAKVTEDFRKFHDNIKSKVTEMQLTLQNTLESSAKKEKQLTDALMQGLRQESQARSESILALETDWRAHLASNSVTRKEFVRVLTTFQEEVRLNLSELPLRFWDSDPQLLRLRKDVDVLAGKLKESDNDVDNIKSLLKGWSDAHGADLKGLQEQLCDVKADFLQRMSEAMELLSKSHNTDAPSTTTPGADNSLSKQLEEVVVEQALQAEDMKHISSSLGQELETLATMHKDFSSSVSLTLSVIEEELTRLSKRIDLLHGTTDESPASARLPSLTHLQKHNNVSEALDSSRSRNNDRKNTLHDAPSTIATSNSEEQGSNIASTPTPLPDADTPEAHSSVHDTTPSTASEQQMPARDAPTSDSVNAGSDRAEATATINASEETTPPTDDANVHVSEPQPSDDTAPPSNSTAEADAQTTAVQSEHDDIKIQTTTDEPAAESFDNTIVQTHEPSSNATQETTDAGDNTAEKYDEVSDAAAVTVSHDTGDTAVTASHNTGDTAVTASHNTGDTAVTASHNTGNTAVGFGETPITTTHRSHHQEIPPLSPAAVPEQTED